MSECDENRFVEVPYLICLPAAKSSFPLLLMNKSTSIVVHTSPEMEVEEPDVDEFSMKYGRLCSTSHTIVSIILSILQRSVCRLFTTLWSVWVSTFGARRQKIRFGATYEPYYKHLRLE